MRTLGLLISFEFEKQIRRKFNEKFNPVFGFLKYLLITMNIIVRVTAALWGRCRQQLFLIHLAPAWHGAVLPAI